MHCSQRAGAVASRESLVTDVKSLGRDPDFVRLRRLQRRYAFAIAGSVVVFYASLGVAMAYWPEVLDVRLVPGRWITVGLVWNVLGLLGWFAATAAYAALSTRRLTPLRAQIRQRHGWRRPADDAGQAQPPAGPDSS